MSVNGEQIVGFFRCNYAVRISIRGRVRPSVIPFAYSFGFRHRIRFPFQWPDRAQLEGDVWLGLGGSCFSTATVLNDLLRSAGFQSHVIEGFYAGNLASRHLAVVVTDVERLGEAFYIDIGSFFPGSQVMDISSVVRPDEPMTAGWREDYAPEEFGEAGFRLQVIMG